MVQLYATHTAALLYTKVHSFCKVIGYIFQVDVLECLHFLLER